MLILRKPRLEDRFEIEECYGRSESLHRPWVFPPESYESYLQQDGRYFLSLESSGEIVGTFNISGVVRGFFQSGYLGYEVFLPHNGKGYMSVGMRLLLEEAFSNLGLHRLEANVQPGNIDSIKLLSKAGFIKEGFSKSYLNIGGLGWKDHERWAIVNNEWKSGNS
ncbi:GNAT family N-acetyltransferase [Paraglaciecola mesophila]|uniref:GNAT family N-acetyltransferase n=1 Tax=Paraglaciecola mesophila TaxID=197222 RepID=A0ABU9T157_9ALTE